MVNDDLPIHRFMVWPDVGKVVDGVNWVYANTPVTISLRFEQGCKDIPNCDVFAQKKPLPGLHSFLVSIRIQISTPMRPIRTTAIAALAAICQPGTQIRTN